jgi:hypothetical protein
MKIRSVAVAAALALALGIAASALADSVNRQDQARAGDHAAGQLVSLEMKSASAADISTQLSALLGKPVVFVSSNPDELFSMQVQDYPMGELLADLAKRGAIAVGGRPLEPGTPGSAKDLSSRVSLDAKELDAPAVSRLLSGLMQTEVDFQPAGPAGSPFRVNLDVKGMPIGELLKQLEQLGKISLHTPFH